MNVPNERNILCERRMSKCMPYTRGPSAPLHPSALPFVAQRYKEVWYRVEILSCKWFNTNTNMTRSYCTPLALVHYVMVTSALRLTVHTHPSKCTHPSAHTHTHTHTHTPDPVVILYLYTQWRTKDRELFEMLKRYCLNIHRHAHFKVICV